MNRRAIFPIAFFALALTLLANPLVGVANASTSHTIAYGDFNDGTPAYHPLGVTFDTDWKAVLDFSALTWDTGEGACAIIQFGNATEGTIRHIDIKVYKPSTDISAIDINYNDGTGAIKIGGTTSQNITETLELKLTYLGKISVQNSTGYILNNYIVPQFSIDNLGASGVATSVSAGSVTIVVTQMFRGEPIYSMIAVVIGLAPLMMVMKVFRKIN